MPCCNADRGEVDGAFVYKTDAEQMAKNVKILFTVPQDLYPRVTYPMALTVGQAAGKLKPWHFSSSSDRRGTGVLARYGFVVR